MSVATEFRPVVYIPPCARPVAERSATVTALHRPSDRSVAAPLRLTRRGVTALAAAVGLLAVALVALAWLSAPGAAASRSPVPVSVTVRSGDTLWSIASRVAPEHDPRGEVAELQRLNHLSGVALVPGQVLKTK